MTTPPPHTHTRGGGGDPEFAGVMNQIILFVLNGMLITTDFLQDKLSSTFEIPLG